MLSGGQAKRRQTSSKGNQKYCKTWVKNWRQIPSMFFEIRTWPLFIRWHRLRAQTYKTALLLPLGTSPGYHLCLWSPAKNQRFSIPSPWIQLICQSSSQNSEKQYTCWITGYYKGISFRTSLLEEMHGPGMRERAQSFHSFSLVPFSPHLYMLTNQSRSSLNKVLLGFYRDFIT